MNNDHTNPYQRKPQALFAKTNPAPAPKTTPFGETPPYANTSQESPTLPMPGVEGATVPDTVFTPVSRIPMFPTRENNLGPVVGWLVILSGPGRGHSLELGYGRNSIGRGPDNEVCLPFGDSGISDKAHAYIAHDKVSGKAFLLDGNSRNLVYLDGAPSFGTAEIKSGCTIQLGATVLMYVAFCTTELDWKNIPDSNPLSSK